MEVVFIDFETGGLKDDSPNIQLAAIAVDVAWDEIASFSAKIKFDESAADPEALRINHYDREVWAKEAEPEAYVLGRFDSFLSNHKSVEMVSKRTGRPYSVARLAGHNISTFDYPRLRRMYRERFIPAHPMALDTLQLAMWHWHGNSKAPENLRLETIMKFLGVEFDGAHDALADVRAAANLAKILVGH